MEDDVVVVAALGEGGEVVARLKEAQPISVTSTGEKEMGTSSPPQCELAYLGGMSVVKFEGYGALRKVSKVCGRHGELGAPWSCLG